MATWTSDELSTIGAAEELEIASVRRDGTLRKPVTIWVVRHYDDLYVRSVNGRGSSWFRGAPTGSCRPPASNSADPDVTYGLRARLHSHFRPTALIEFHTLTDGGQAALDVARKLAAFLERAERTMELALYDVRLDDDTAAVVRAALLGANERGVKIRLLYNVDRPDRFPVPPPPKTEPELIESLPFETAGIPGWPDLMHHKYVVRDGAAVWTGSTNWTDDSWTREENVIAILESAPVAARFGEDFEQLWKTREVDRSGKVDSSPVDVDGKPVRTWFSPKRGEKLAHQIARGIASAERRVRIASPVITSGPILGTLAEVAADGKVDLAGVVDATQIDDVLGQWKANGNATWKTPSLRFVLDRASFTGKRSTPYAPGAVHDYMHAKVTVCDDTVFAGSFNLSHSGEQNAENVVEVEDAALAEQMTTFVDEIRAKYEPLRL